MSPLKLSTTVRMARYSSSEDHQVTIQAHQVRPQCLQNASMVSSKQTKSLVLVALNGTSGSATLDVKIDDNSDEEGTYGISVPDLGESYGTAVLVLATKGVEWPHFYYGENEIDPQRTAASQDWYGELYGQH